MRIRGKLLVDNHTYSTCNSRCLEEEEEATTRIPFPSEPAVFRMIRGQDEVGPQLLGHVKSKLGATKL